MIKEKLLENKKKKTNTNQYSIRVFSRTREKNIRFVLFEKIIFIIQLKANFHPLNGYHIKETYSLKVFSIA